MFDLFYLKFSHPCFVLPSSNERSHMIPSIYVKLSFASVEEVFSKMGCFDQFTKGELRFLATQIKWQVFLLFLQIICFLEIAAISFPA